MSTSLPTLTMLAGIPGSGKSTYAKTLCDNYIHIHSSDLIRYEILGDENCQENNQLVFQELHKRVKNDLKHDISCVYDATNLNSKRRIAFLNDLRDTPCNKNCILFITPVEVCKILTKHRSRNVPDHVIDNMVKSFQCPYYYEGWDNIQIIFFDERAVLPDIFTPFDQENPYHSLSLRDHLTKTQDLCEYWHFNDRICEAAFYHDVGKYCTKTFYNSKGNPSKYAHYYGHENYGAYLFLSQFCGRLAPDKLISDYLTENDIEGILYVALLINLHMKPHTSWKQSQKAKSRDHRLLGDKIYNDVLSLYMADISAR